MRSAFSISVFRRERIQRGRQVSPFEGRQPWFQVLLNVAGDEICHLPDFVDKAPVAFDPVFVEIDIVARRAAGQQCKTQRVGAVLVHQF